MVRSLLSRPGLMVVLALVLIVGGCSVIEAAQSELGAGDYTAAPGGSGQGVPRGFAGYTGPPAVGATPQAPPERNDPTWVGDLRVTDLGPNLSSQPPAVDEGAYYDSTIEYESSQLIVRSGPAAAWNSPTDPTYQQCVSQIQTQPLASSEPVSYRQGQGLCVVTYSKTAIAFVRALDPSPGANAVEMRGIRWQRLGS